MKRITKLSYITAMILFASVIVLAACQSNSSSELSNQSSSTSSEEVTKTTPEDVKRLMRVFLKIRLVR